MFYSLIKSSGHVLFIALLLSQTSALAQTPQQADDPLWSERATKARIAVLDVAIKTEALENIVLNGIAGVDGICDMIKDCIDSGDLQGAKDWIDQLNEEIYEVSE